MMGELMRNTQVYRIACASPSPAAGGRSRGRILVILARAGRSLTMSEFWIWWIAAAILVARRTAHRDVLSAGHRRGRGIRRCRRVARRFVVPVQWLIAGALGVAGHRCCCNDGSAASRRARRRSRGSTSAQRCRCRAGARIGTARVSYRGCTWDAELATPDTPQPSTMYIAAHARVGAASCRPRPAP